jgi:hypothetical protein
MTSLDEGMRRMIRRNKLLGMWAAEKLGLVGEAAKAYSDGLATGTLDFERSDVLRKIREDFRLAGVVQSDDEVLRVANEFWLQASSPELKTRGDARDGAVLHLARNLLSR